LNFRHKILNAKAPGHKVNSLSAYSSRLAAKPNPTTPKKYRTTEDTEIDCDKKEKNTENAEEKVKKE